MRLPKRFVYVLKTDTAPPHYYTGLTSNVAQRLMAHNTGHCSDTAKSRPWSLDLVVEFADERRAVAFERYLKSGSGVAFAQRHSDRSATTNCLQRQRAPELPLCSFQEQIAGDGAPLPPLFGGGAVPLFYQLVDERNGLRLPAYARLDLRADRTFTWSSRRVTLFAEVANTLNRRNLRTF